MNGKAYQAKRPISLLAPDGVANRTAGTVDGTAMVMQQVPVAALAPGAVAGRSITRLVAASNASAQMQAGADYVCDGTADEVEINAALASLPAGGGTVLLSEGTFTIAAQISLGGARRTLQGMGLGATTLAVVNAGGAPVNVPIVNLNADYCKVADLTVDGNKANNAAATGMIGVQAITAIDPVIQRVRVVNSRQYGIGTHTSVQNGVVRDCLVENADGVGGLFRAADGQPLVVSGCTFKGSTGSGVSCDIGPIALSDCQVLSGAGVGFSFTGTALVSATNCTAQGNANRGFNISAARAQLTGCRSISDTSQGFSTSGAQTQFVGCLAQGTLTSGSGFRTESAATDALFSGCAASDNTYAGFLHLSTGRATYVGCRATNNTSYGFQVSDGAAHILGCYVYGIATSSHGISLSGGANHTVDGCRIANNGGHGVRLEAAVVNAQVTSNFLLSNGLAANLTYHDISLEADNVFIHGNVTRDAGAGNRVYAAIAIGASSSDSFIGQNDLRPTEPGNIYIYDGGVNTRRVAKLQLDYVASTDLIGGTLVSVQVWTDIGTNQTFRVDAPGSIVEIACRGNMQVGAQGVCEVSTRLVIDSGGTPLYRKLGGDITETAGGYQNPLAGSQPVKLQGLAVGTHTVKLQIYLLNVASYAWLRAASFAPYEHLGIQVTEFAR